MAQGSFTTRLEAIQSYSDADPARALQGLDELAKEGCQETLMFMMKALIHHNMDEYAQAAEAFSRVLADRPDNDVASMLLFECLWRMGDRDGALREKARFQAAAGRKDWQLPDDIGSEMFPHKR